MFHPAQRALQDRFDERRIADRIHELLVHDRFTEEDAAFIQGVDCFFLATADPEGRPTCSYKGGEPGFVRVLGPDALVFPCFDGNGMFLSMGNVGANPNVGLLFIDFEDPSRMRVNGVADIVENGTLCPPWPEAQFVVRVRPREIFPNCPRYIHKRALVERSSFVPKAGCKTPIPEWKESDWANPYLAGADPARRSAARRVPP
jgi:predicted pyridoxine 5'-phosphate oxidase superfamily flavin-nucleotide-binding protein